MRTSVRSAALAASLLAAGATFAAMAGHGREDGEPHEGRGHHGPGKMMEKLDADKDGVITRAEIDAAQAAHIARIDRDANGAVTVEEMDQMHRPERLERQAKHLKRLDANNDGVVTTAEFAEGHRARLQKMDRDGDGRITREEMEQHRGHRGRHGRDGDKG